MTDFSFDLALWKTWSTVIFWFLTGLGILSGIFAFNGGYRNNSSADTRSIALIVVLVTIVLLGYFPIEWGFGTDRANYAYGFLRTQSNGLDIAPGQKDVGFGILTWLLGKFLSVQQYFVAVAAIYIFNYYYTIRKLVQSKTYWLLIAVLLSMGFTSYALNTMRAGLALSFIVLSFSFYPSKWKMIVCLLVASNIHNSAAIPSLMVAVSYLFPNTKLYYKLWILSIPTSFVAGNFFMSFFAGMGSDDRVSYLYTDIATTYNIGFRIDFILYSLAPVIIGGYYIFKRHFDNQFYRLIYNSFLLTNIFWILVIRANYSDRFAYLSWFMIPFILVYPLLKTDVVKNPGTWLSLILLGETVFKSFF